MSSAEGSSTPDTPPRPVPPSTARADLEAVGRAPSPRATRLRECLVFGLKALIVCSFVAAVFVASRRLEGRAHAAPRHAVVLGAWSVVDQPHWVSDQDLYDLRENTGFSHLHMSLLDRRGLAAVRDRFADCVEVRDVLAVERRLPNRLVVALELRRPAALVRVESGDRPSDSPSDGPEHTPLASDTREAGAANGATPTRPSWVVVDRDGVVLRAAPRTIDTTQVAGGPAAADGMDLRDLPRIVGAEVGRTEPGVRLGPDVRESVRLLRRLDAAAEEHPRLVAFDTVDVSNWAGRRSRLESEVELVGPPLGDMTPSGDVSPGTDHDAPADRPEDRSASVEPCRVAWGRIGPRAHADEPSFHRKRDHLLRALELSPGLADFRLVRVAFGDLYVVPRDASVR